MVEEVIAVPHGQQCLEEICSIKEQVVLAPNLVLEGAGGGSLRGTLNPRSCSQGAEAWGSSAFPSLQQSNGRATSSSWDPGFPTAPSAPTDMGMLSPAALQRGPHDVPRVQRPPPAALGQ